MFIPCTSFSFASIFSKQYNRNSQFCTLLEKWGTKKIPGGRGPRRTGTAYQSYPVLSLLLIQISFFFPLVLGKISLPNIENFLTTTFHISLQERLFKQPINHCKMLSYFHVTLNGTGPTFATSVSQIPGCHQIMKCRENQGNLYSVRENQERKKKFFKGSRESWKFKVLYYFLSVLCLSLYGNTR